MTLDWILTCHASHHGCANSVRKLAEKLSIRFLNITDKFPSTFKLVQSTVRFLDDGICWCFLWVMPTFQRATDRRIGWCYCQIRCIAQRVFLKFEGILGFSVPSIIFADLLGNTFLVERVQKVMVCDLWYVIGGFWSVWFAFVFQGSLLVIVLFWAIID